MHQIVLGRNCTATLLINITPSSVTSDKSPDFRIHESSFNYFLLCTFGCVSFILLPAHEGDKLSSKMSKCIPIGYSLTHKGYRCYDLFTKPLHFSSCLLSLKCTSPFRKHPRVSSYSSLCITLKPASQQSAFESTNITNSPSSPVDIQVTNTEAPCVTTNAPTSLGDRHPPRRNLPYNCHPSARYCDSANSTNFSAFSKFFPLSIHCRNLSHIVKPQNLQNRRK